MGTIRALLALAVALPCAPFDDRAGLAAHCAWSVVRRSSTVRMIAIALVAFAGVAAIAWAR